MKKVLTLCACLLTVWSVSFLPVRAAESQDNAQVRYEISKDGKYDLTVQVSGGGELRDGEKTIRSGEVTYRLSVGESKMFLVVPDAGYEVGNAVCEQPDTKQSEDITKEASSGKVTVVMNSTKNILRVDFSEKEESGSGIFGGIAKSVKTGDYIQYGALIALVISAFVIVAGSRNKEGIK